jgi:protein-tyrosine phosphatase
MNLPGSIELPDGTPIRGRGLRNGPVPGPAPDFGLYLGTARLHRRHADSLPWPQTWIPWPDFLLPRDQKAAIAAIHALHRRAQSGDHVEIACNGGVGRTGTVIACLAILSGLPPTEVIPWTRTHYHPHAIETPWQRRWVRRFPTP